MAFCLSLAGGRIPAPPPPRSILARARELTLLIMRLYPKTNGKQCKKTSVQYLFCGSKSASRKEKKITQRVALQSREPLHVLVDLYQRRSASTVHTADTELPFFTNSTFLPARSHASRSTVQKTPTPSFFFLMPHAVRTYSGATCCAFLPAHNTLPMRASQAVANTSGKAGA